MNRLDLFLLFGCVLSALTGWRYGFTRRIFGWVGFALGAWLASKAVPSILSGDDEPTAIRFAEGTAIVMGGGLLLQALASTVGTRLQYRLREAELGPIDSVAGSILGVARIVLVAWILIPLMIQVQGWPATTARSSVAAGVLRQTLGEPPDILSGLGDGIGVAGLTDVLGGIGVAGVVPEAPASNRVPKEVLASVQPSVLKISGPACGRVQSGSGVVVAPRLIATNAHVVAGSERLTVAEQGGRGVNAVVVHFDPEQDIAILRADSLDAPALPTITAAEGSQGSILGFPNGGDLAIQPYEVASVTTTRARDIYDEREVKRRIIVVGSMIGPGDSGGPLIDVSGRVAGIAFGISPQDAQTAYALPIELVTKQLAGLSTTPVASGRCRT